MTNAEYALLGKLTEANETIAQLEKELADGAELLKREIDKRKVGFWYDDPTELDNLSLGVVEKVRKLQAARATVNTLRDQIYPPPISPEPTADVVIQDQGTL